MKKTIISTTLTFIIVTFVMSIFIINSNKILTSFNIINVTNVSTNFNIKFEKPNHNILLLLIFQI